jgi:hypothetical protein
MNDITKSTTDTDGKEPFKWSGIESVSREVESLAPDDESSLQAQHRDAEAIEIACESSPSDGAAACSVQCGCGCG